MAERKRPTVHVEPLSRAVLHGVRVSEDEPERRQLDVGVIPWFTDERPLKGLAAFVDWRTSGMLSGLVRAGFCSGRKGESVLLPGRGGLPMQRLVLVGLGDSDRFGPSQARAAAATVVDLAGRLRPSDVLFAMPGWIEERDVVEAVFSGLTEALGATPTIGWPPRWWVVANTDHVPRLRRLLEGPPRAADL